MPHLLISVCGVGDSEIARLICWQKKICDAIISHVLRLLRGNESKTNLFAFVNNVEFGFEGDERWIRSLLPFITIGNAKFKHYLWLRNIGYWNPLIACTLQDIMTGNGGLLVKSVTPPFDRKEYSLDIHILTLE